MPFSDLPRTFGAVGALVAGVCFCGAMLISLWSSGPFIVVLLVIGDVGMLEGLLGLHASQASQYGRLGTIGFWLAIIGTVLSLAAGLVTVVAALLRLEDVNADASLALVGYFLLIIGFLLLGIATLRARVLPVWAGLLLVIGSIVMLLLPPFAASLMLLLPPFVAFSFQRLLWTVLGIVLLALSYALWTRGGETGESGRGIVT